MPQQQRKMVALDVEETSGVDHPAHLHEGWVVIKSASPEDVEGIFGVAPVQKKGEVVSEKTELTDIEKALADKAALETKVEELTKALEEATAKAAEKTEPAEADIFKGLPEDHPIRKQLAEQAEEIAKSRELVQKERDARLDGEAIAKSRTVYKSVAIDHDTVAPALRRIAEQSPELAEAVETALRAADGQLETAGIFAEAGSDQADKPDTAQGEIEAAAQSLLTEGTVDTYAKAIAKAVESNPEAAARYFAGKE